MMKKQSRYQLAGIGLTVSLMAGMLTGCGKKETEVVSVSSGSAVQEEIQEEVPEVILPEEQELSGNYTSAEGVQAAPGAHVAVVVKGLGENSYWHRIREGVEAAVSDVNEALGYKGDRKVKLTFEGPSEENNEEEQINTLDTVLSENPTVLCLAAIDMESCEAQLETARDNGIPVLILDAGIESDLVTSVCQTDNRAAGLEAGRKLCEKMGGRGKAALIAHQPETETCKSRVEGFRKALEEYPEVELAAVLEEDPEISMEEQLAAMKENHPDLTGIFATNEKNSDSVLKLYEGEEQKPVLVGFDNGKEQIQAIRDGVEYGCISQNPYSMGYAVVIASLRTAAGEKIDSFIDSGYVWIDQTNIDAPENQSYLYQ